MFALYGIIHLLQFVVYDPLWNSKNSFEHLFPTKVYLVAIEFFVDSSLSILCFSKSSCVLLSLSQAWTFSQFDMSSSIYSYVYKLFFVKFFAL